MTNSCLWTLAVRILIAGPPRELGWPSQLWPRRTAWQGCRCPHGTLSRPVVARALVSYMPVVHDIIDIISCRE